VRSGRDVVYFAHACETFALLHDLLDCAIITVCDDRDARPTRIQCLADREGRDVEAPSTEQTHDPRKLARLIGNDN